MGFNFSVNSAQFQALELELKKDINDILQNRDMLDEVGTMVVERIKYQARIGKPLNVHGTFPNLADSTKKNRAYLAKYNSTHPVFDAEFSNLTITGQLLDALKYIIEGGTSKLSIFFDGIHLPYKGKKGQPLGEEILNQDLSGFLSKKGFDVFDDSIKDNATINSRINTIVLAYIRRGLKVRNQLAK